MSYSKTWLCVEFSFHLCHWSPHSHVFAGEGDQKKFSSLPFYPLTLLHRHFSSFSSFLEASTHLYKRVCLSVYPSVRHAFSKDPRKRLVLVADDTRMNGGTSRDSIYTHTYKHTHARMCTLSHAHAPTHTDEINKTAEFRWRTIAKHTPTYTHTV